MSAGFGSWLLGMLLGASALGGTLGMASGIFGVLAATTFVSALLYAISGFGFAVLAPPLFLLFLDPARAIQLVIIISTVLSIVVLRGLLPAIAPWLLLRLALGSLVGARRDPVPENDWKRAVLTRATFAIAFVFAVSRCSTLSLGQGNRFHQWRTSRRAPGLASQAGDARRSDQVLRIRQSTPNARSGTPAATLPRIPAAPHKGESDDAERRSEHYVEAGRKAVAGHGDEPSRDKGREAAEDRHGDGEAQ
jgi:hypothetical protein